MIGGILLGGIIWSICVSPFFVFPDSLSFALACVIAPFACGYFGTRLGGRTTAYILIPASTVIMLALSLVLMPDISWDYPRSLWSGVQVFDALLILGSLIFSGFGTLIAIQVRSRNEPEARQNIANSSISTKDDIRRGTVPKTLSPFKIRISELETKEKDLENDLAIINNMKGAQQLSHELLDEREKAIQRELLDVILEKSRLTHKSKEN